MRRSEDTPLDPEVAAGLDTIDAALDGRPVDPRNAELAELALLLRGQRPVIEADFSRRLDRAVERRFAAAPVRSAEQPNTARPGRRRRLWIWTPAAGLAASLAVAVAIVAGAGPGAPSRPQTLSGAAADVHPFGPASSRLRSAPSAGLPDSNGQALDLAHGGATQATALQPPSSARHIIQGAQLSLSTRPRLIDQVAQEVFNVVGQEHGFVNSSTVTASGGPGAYGQFQLSIPSSNLAQAMTLLSSLPHARVLSRTDTTQDVTSSYQADQRRLADARALRASLLRQLAGAATQGQIDSLRARIHDAETEISADEAALHSLQHQVSYSQVTVSLGAAVPVPRTVHSSSGFTLGHAVHVAGRVLTVAAGVVLIGLAALVPLGLLGGLAWWVSTRVRRRRRLQALDLV